MSGIEPDEHDPLETSPRTRLTDAERAEILARQQDRGDSSPGPFLFP